MPNIFYISISLEKYSSDGTIAFREEAIKDIYYIAEIKWSMDSLELSTHRKIKNKCAKKHFKEISNGEVIYDVVDNCEALLNLITR